MLKELFVGLFACLALMELTEAKCYWSRANGCSVPGNLPFFYKRKFTNACNRHDICYYCGAKKGVSQKKCDNYFYANMKKVCRWYTCKAFAASYFAAVRARGHKHYEKTSPRWCNQRWVSGCMN